MNVLVVEDRIEEDMDELCKGYMHKKSDCESLLCRRYLDSVRMKNNQRKKNVKRKMESKN